MYVGDPVYDVGNLLITYTLSVYQKEKLELSDFSIHVFHSEVSNRSFRFLALNRKDQGYESKGATNYTATPGGQSCGDHLEPGISISQYTLLSYMRLLQFLD